MQKLFHDPRLNEWTLSYFAERRCSSLIEQDRAVIQRILCHLSLPGESPELRPARPPPLPFDTHPLSLDDDLAAFDPGG